MRGVAARVLRAALRIVLVVALVAGAGVWAGPALLAPDPAPTVAGDGQRGINVDTLLSQAVTIHDHPDMTNTGEPQASYTYLASRGHRLIRLSVSWDHLQPRLDARDRGLDAAYWRAVRAEVAKIRAAGMRTVLDLHNGCEWTRPKTTTTLLCGAGLSTADTTGVWRTISSAFRDDPSVAAYDLFNEPVRFDHPTRPELRKPGNQPLSVYKEHVNAVVAAIRANRDTKPIWVESLCCNRMFDFSETDPNGGWVVDPAHRIVYSQHMYPVNDSARGETFDPAKTDPGYENPRGDIWADRGYEAGFLQRLDRFARWCGRSALQCSIGEVGWYGWGQSPESAARWNELGRQWYRRADRYGLAVIYFGASSARHGALWAYDTPGEDAWFPAAGLSRRQPQADVIEDPANLSR